ncbi:MAG: C4-dicarboxylate ABC transporter permease [Spirochaetes bacterium RBG_13_68_11]|nr:MAG: C4-dicarboxylate ABC transporter permease [Spirochaetes bacterium RBG_13_68_11]
MTKGYVDGVTATSKAVGQFAMYLVFGMIGILFFETVSRTVFNRPWIWTVEMAQFVMAAYYTLGGAYTLILDGHVRMDLTYARWSPKNKALADVLTFSIVMVYLVVLLVGGIISLEYSIKYNQKSYSPWAPTVTPIKIIMVFGILLMTLQVIAEFFKDLATLRGKTTKSTEQATEKDKT